MAFIIAMKIIPKYESDTYSLDPESLLVWSICSLRGGKRGKGDSTYSHFWRFIFILSSILEVIPIELAWYFKGYFLLTRATVHHQILSCNLRRFRNPRCPATALQFLIWGDLHLVSCCLISNTWWSLFQAFDVYRIPLVHLEKTLYCSIPVISGTDAA